MITAIFISFFKIFLPIGVTAYLLVGWLLHSGRLEPFGNKKELEEKLKTLKKGHKENKKGEKNFAVKKWMTFGGGFYGTAALYTYAVIEFGEIISFFFKILNPANWSFDISIDLIVGFIINSVMNFVSAILWFQYWEIGDTAYIWINFIAAYLAYALGAKLANIHLAENVGHPQLWRWWQTEKARRAAETGGSQGD